MSGKFEIEMTPHEKGVLRALDQINKNADKMAEKLDKAGKAGSRAGASAKSGIDRASGAAGQFAKRLASVTFGIEGIMQAARVLKNEYDAMINRQRSAVDAKANAALAVRRAAVNFSPDKTLSLKQFTPALEGIAERTRTNLGIVADAAGGLLSAKGNLTNKQGLDILEQSLRVLPNDAAAADTIPARVADINKMMPDADPRQIIGFMIQAMGKSRVKQLGQFGKTGIPAMLALTKSGDTFEQSAELFAAVTAFSGDETGDVSKSGLTNLAKKLTDFKSSAPGSEQFANAKSTTERIAILQQNKQLQAEFLAKNSFESGVDPTFRAMIRGDRKFMGLFSDAQQSIGAIRDPSQTKGFESFIGGLEGLKLQGALTLKQRLETNKQKTNIEKGDALGRAVEILESSFEDFDFTLGTDTARKLAIRTSFEAGLKLDQLEGVPSRPLANVREILGGVAAGEFGGGIDENERRSLLRTIQLIKEQEREIRNQQRRTKPSVGVQAR